MFIDKPPYFYEYMAPETFTMPQPEIKLNNAVEGVKKSSRIAANILEKCETILKVRSYIYYCVVNIYANLSTENELIHFSRALPPMKSINLYTANALKRMHIHHR